MAARSTAALILAAAALAAGCGSTAETAQEPPPLAGVEERITPDGLTEHLTALQAIAAEHGGTRAFGTPGERATADYIAERLRAAGYRAAVRTFSLPYFAETAPARLTVGSRRRTVRTLQFSGSATVSGRVRAAGTGCAQASFRALQRGEVALVRRGGCGFRSKVLHAQRAGAAAVLISDRSTFGGSLRRPGVRVPVLSVGRDGAGLAGVRVRVRVRAESGMRRSQNVIGEAGAADAPRVVMAGAHLDSVPKGPGLNDNGSGVAAVLEIAEQLGGRALPAGTALRFGFWGAEEIGLEGSTRYVRGLGAAERRRIAAYVNLDMVGSPGGVAAVYSDDADIAAALRRRLGADAPSINLFGSSDHTAFAEARIPVGGVFTGLDDCYHQACDRIANVDRELATRVARAAGGAVVDFVK
jgi:hypothetical protein